MNKQDLIQTLATRTGTTQAAAKAHLDALIDTLTERLKRGEPVAITGFGTFSVRNRAARRGRNPATGEEITVRASRAPAFKPGKTFRESI